MGKASDERPAMQVATYWNITNPTDKPIRILKTFVVRPRTDGMVSVKDSNSNYFGSYAVPPGGTTELHAYFWINPPIRKEGKTISLDIVFIDQFGQKRKVKSVEISSDKRTQRRPKMLDNENVWSLSNEVEKKVVSVLKDEIARYKKFGRRQGLLGSTYAEHHGHQIRQIYQDSWTSNKAGQRQEIANQGESAVKTENGDALVKYFNTLSEKSEKDGFVNALLIRLNRQQEYYCVSYLILYILFRIGKLSDALETSYQTLSYKKSWFSVVKEKFTGPILLEAHQQYGYSDFFGMLNGLLRYEHASFSDTDLDEIEKYISKIEEHTFQISEKINSIRSLRVADQLAFPKK